MLKIIVLVEANKKINSYFVIRLDLMGFSFLYKMHCIEQSWS